MKAVKTIDMQDWMVSDETKMVMDALNASGEKALFVGGCVRNALLEADVTDIDIATQWNPQEVCEKFETMGVKAIPTGIEHGTVTVAVDGKAFEVTTLRKDVETDGRRAVVAFTDDWGEDAQRRDFTMNTLLMDQGGQVFDPTGQGIKDLDARQVRFVGDAEQRIAEDYLRILRLFRFHALYGVGELDASALEACRAGADKIENLSRERITQEFFKIMSVDDPAAVLAIMFANNVLKAFEFKEYDPKFLKYVCDFQLNYGLGFLAARIFVLAGLCLENVKAMEEFILFPKVFQKDIQAVSQVLKLPDLSEEQAVKAAIYKYGRVPTAQALIVELANDRVMNGYAPEALDIIQNWDVPNFPVNGEDLMKVGIKQGPKLGERLEALEDFWIEGGFKAGKDQCLEKL